MKTSADRHSELPSTLRAYWDGKRAGAFRTVKDRMLASYPAGACELVIEMPAGPAAGFWIAGYYMDEDSTDAHQRLDWEPAKKKMTETWESSS